MQWDINLRLVLYQPRVCGLIEQTLIMNHRYAVRHTCRIPNGTCTRSRLDRPTENSHLLSPDENFMPFLDISRVHHYCAVSSQVMTLLLSSLLSTAVATAFAKEGLAESLTEDIEHPRTILTGSFGIAYFTTVGCTGAAKRADVLATDEAGTPQPFQPTRAAVFTLPMSECTLGECTLAGSIFWRPDPALGPIWRFDTNQPGRVRGAWLGHLDRQLRVRTRLATILKVRHYPLGPIYTFRRTCLHLSPRLAP